MYTLFNMDITLILAIWGSLLSTTLAVIEVKRFMSDKPNVLVSVRGGYGMYPSDTIYGDRNYICISAANSGRRKVVLTKAALLAPRGDRRRYAVSGDSLQKVELTEGNSHDYLIAENEINFPPAKYVACVIDATGRYYRSHNFLVRFLKLGRVK